MPALNYSPNGMLSLQFSLAELAGADLWSDSLGTVAAPSTFDKFADIFDLLHGNCSVTGRDLAALLNTALTVNELPGTFTAFIRPNDLIAVSYSEGAFSFRATSATNPYGFDTDSVESSEYEGAQTVTAARYFSFGNFDGGDVGTFEITIGADTATAFDDAGKHQGVIQRVRPAGLTDRLAGAATNLTALAGGADRFLLNDAGKVEFWRSGSARGALTWESDLLRDFLGFTGYEAASTVDGYLRLVATHAPKATLFLNRPIEFIEPRVRGLRRASEASDGHVESAHLLTRRGWDLRFAVTGIADTEDKTAEALDGFFMLLWKAEHFSVYQNAQEPRVAVSNRELFGIDKTPEDNYRVGRLRLVLDQNVNEIAFDLEDVQIRLRYFFELRGWDWIA